MEELTDLIPNILSFSNRALPLRGISKRWMGDIDQRLKDAFNTLNTKYPGEMMDIQETVYSTLYTQLREAIRNLDTDTVSAIVSTTKYLPVPWDLLAFDVAVLQKKGKSFYNMLSHRWTKYGHAAYNLLRGNNPQGGEGEKPFVKQNALIGETVLTHRMYLDPDRKKKQPYLTVAANRVAYKLANEDDLKVFDTILHNDINNIAYLMCNMYPYPEDLSEYTSDSDPIYEMWYSAKHGEVGYLLDRENIEFYPYPPFLLIKCGTYSCLIGQISLTPYIRMI